MKTNSNSQPSLIDAFAMGHSALPLGIWAGMWWLTWQCLYLRKPQGLPHAVWAPLMTSGSNKAGLLIDGKLPLPTVSPQPVTYPTQPGLAASPPRGLCWWPVFA